MKRRNFESASQNKNEAAVNAQTKVTLGVDGLDRLERILSRVPPIITLPRPKDRCPYTGQSRTSMLELVAPCERNNFKPPVKAIYKRSHKHAVRGRWLIPSENLFSYLLALSDDTATEVGKAREERETSRTEGRDHDN